MLEMRKFIWSLTTLSMMQWQSVHLKKIIFLYKMTNQKWHCYLWAKSGLLFYATIDQENFISVFNQCFCLRIEKSFVTPANWKKSEKSEGCIPIFVTFWTFKQVQKVISKSNKIILCNICLLSDWANCFYVSTFSTRWNHYLFHRNC